MAISARHNRSKGARGPEEWAPPDNALWCQYALDWTEIKAHWGLTMTQRESEIVMDMLGTCEDPPRYEVEVLTGMVVVPGEDKPEAEESVYGSCEEAENAGEERVQGRQGGGREFLQRWYPAPGMGTEMEWCVRGEETMPAPNWDSGILCRGNGATCYEQGA